MKHYFAKIGSILIAVMIIFVSVSTAFAEDTLKINDAKEGDTITIDTVLLVSDGDKVSVGTPYVKGAKVTVEVGETFKDKKVLVFKYKSKKDYHRFHGHREQYTYVTVKDVVSA